jgi:hypothetical protein
MNLTALKDNTEKWNIILIEAKHKHCYDVDDATKRS